MSSNNFTYQPRSRFGYGARNVTNDNGYSLPSIDYNEIERQRAKRQTTTMWANVADVQKDGVDPNSIYIGEYRSTVPLWSQKVLDRNERAQAYEDWKAGRISQDAAQFAGWDEEFHEDLKNFYDAVKNGAYQKHAATGTIVSADNKTINLAIVMDKILGIDTRDYQLKNALTSVSAPNLRLSVDTFSGFGIERDVPEGVEALTQKGRFTRQEIALTKDVSHIQQTDEAMYESDKDLMAIHIRHSGQKFNETIEAKIVSVLEGSAAGSTGGTDWGAYTSDHSTTNPFEEIGNQIDTIVANGGDENQIVVASSPKAFRDFTANTNVRGQTNVVTPVGSTNKVYNVAGIGQWFISNQKSDTAVTIFDKSAVLFVQGPVRTETYRDPKHGYDGYITRNWNRVWLLDATLIENLTGVHA